MVNGRHRNRVNGKPRQREYDKSARTRLAILAAAMDEFVEHGYGGARIDRVAKAAKLNNQALYYHFGDKESLFQAALEHGYASLRANMAPRDLGAMDPETAMATIVSDVFDFVRHMPKHLTMTFEVNRNRGAKLTPEIRGHVRVAIGLLIDAIASVLERGRAAGRFTNDGDPEHLYFSIFALCSFYFTNAYTASAGVGRNLLTPRAVRERKQEIIRFVLAGLRP